MSDDIVDAALAYARRGWSLFPCDLEKHPKTAHGFKDATTDPAIIRRWFAEPDTAIGFDCGGAGLVVIDLDVKRGADGPGAWDRLKRQNGIDDSGALQQMTPSGGRHLIFADTTGGAIRNSAGKLGGGIDVRANGGYILLAPSVARNEDGTAGAYRAIGDWDREPGPLPGPITALLTAQDAPRETPPPRPPTNGRSSAYGRAAFDAELAAIRASVDGTRNDQLNRSAYSLAQLVAGGALDRTDVEGALLSEAIGRGLPEREARRTLASAFEAGLLQPRTAPEPTQGRQAPSSSPTPAAIDDDQAGTPTAVPAECVDPAENKRLTDLGMARRLALQHGWELRYTADLGWLCWDGRRWETDKVGRVNRAAKATARSLFQEAAAAMYKAEEAVKAFEAASLADDDAGLEKAAQAKKDAQNLADDILSWAHRVQGRSRIEAMIALAQSELEIVARTEDFDRDPWALNCQNATLDLRTGRLRPHRREDGITKLVPVAYDPTATCPLWEAFLARVMDNNTALIGFLQRAIGYTLTGNTREQCLFFLWGGGANGKSTFAETVFALLGDDYAQRAQTETLLVRRNGAGIPNDIAALRGARFVLASEVEEGRRLNESLVKDLVGGDTLTARFLHREFFAFKPAFKLVLVGNHKPVIRGTDLGIWRRIRLVPFTVTIPDADKDPNMCERLQAELTGILAWAVRGCLAWQRDGLQPPADVIHATEDYRRDMDVLAGFLADCCIILKDARAKASELHSAYVEYSGQKHLSTTAFRRLMEDRGYHSEKTRGGISWQGLGLIRTDSGDDDD